VERGQIPSKAGQASVYLPCPSDKKGFVKGGLRYLEYFNIYSPSLTKEGLGVDLQRLMFITTHNAKYSIDDQGFQRERS